MEDKLIDSMKRYLDETYGDMYCLVSNRNVIWCKDGQPIASVSRGEDNRLRLSSSEFYGFIRTFSLSWQESDDDIFLLKLIIPYLKFNGGSPAIPILMDLGFIGKLTQIGLPSFWN